ncbi:MAG: biopolymer transporter ExbD [Paracoccaceae bacterium]
MRLAPPRTRRRSDPLLPMIDVVFFLIVFYMIVSSFAEPEPFPIAPPQSASAAPVEGELALFLGPDGTVAIAGATGPITGDAALAELAARCAAPGCGPLRLHADAAAPASALAALLPRLAAAGHADIRLVTVQP